MKLHIPSPCSENWNQMLPVEKGRFCASCQKNIPDFTNKSDQEILEHIKNSGGQICGKFDPSQLNRKLVYSYKFPFRYNRVAASAIGFFSLLGSTFAQQNKKVKDEAGREFIASGNNKEQSMQADTGYIVITGIVKDNQNDEPMPFVNIDVKGTSLRAFTDLDGKFTFRIPADSVTENFSLRTAYIGYQSQETELNKRMLLQGAISREIKMEIHPETLMVGMIVTESPRPKNIFKRIFGRKH